MIRELSQIADYIQQNLLEMQEYIGRIILEEFRHTSIIT